MSQIPKDLKSKYNKNDKFIWVDSQLEKLMNRQKELENKILKLEMENAELKDQVLDLGGEYKKDEDNPQLELFPPNDVVLKW